MSKHSTATGKTTQLRVSRRVQVAIEKMVDHALTRQEAAKLAGLTDHALYCALRKPHVQALRHERMEVLRKSEASRSIKRVADLADTSKSDAVKLDANELLLDLAGEGPIQRGEVTHTHQGLAPGLTINLVQAPPAKLDVTPEHDNRPAPLHSLPVPVAHPSQRIKGNDHG